MSEKGHLLSLITYHAKSVHGNMVKEKMKYEEWLATVPEQFKEDALWKIEAYRLGLFVGDLGWHDVSKLIRERRTMSLSDQLYRALGSISTNIAEGFSRNSHKEKARFYEYALGSARESRDWYYKARHVLDSVVIQHRIDLLTQIIRLLLRMIPDQRQQALKESKIEYQTNDSWPVDAPLPTDDES